MLYRIYGIGTCPDKGICIIVCKEHAGKCPNEDVEQFEWKVHSQRALLLLPMSATIAALDCFIVLASPIHLLS